MGTLTVDEVKHWKPLGLAIVVGRFTFSNSYTTGGEALDLSPHIGARKIHVFIAENAGGYIFEYDSTNKKLKAYFFDYDAAADGGAIEVPALTDLSTVTTRFIAVAESLD